ncbi:MAG TPA: nitroreductase [Alphaproteobacteria bacterium]|nr:nitroreductase [Alphaproteobacteria bacterium]
MTALRSRASAIKLREPGPSRHELDQIMAAAVNAPDHGKLHPWRFIVIEGEARRRFGVLLADALRRREPDAPGARLEAERAKPLRAPMLVVVVGRPDTGSKIPEIEQIVSAGAAAQSIVLAVHALGYGCFWRTGAAAYDAMVKRGLGLAEVERVIGFLHLGTVEVPGRPREIDPLAFVSWWRGEEAA